MTQQEATGSPPIKVFLAKTSMDGHWRGVAVVAAGLRDAGMEVIYGGVLSPRQIAESALQEDVDVLGLNIGGLYGAVQETIRYLRESDAGDILVVAGGSIPADDIPQLQEMGVAGVFPPGSTMKSIVDFICSKRRNS